MMVKITFSLKIMMLKEKSEAVTVHYPGIAEENTKSTKCTLNCFCHIFLLTRRFSYSFPSLGLGIVVALSNISPTKLTNIKRTQVIKELLPFFLSFLRKE